jgi:hypothetical protein
VKNAALRFAAVRAPTLLLAPLLICRAALASSPDPSGGEAAVPPRLAVICVGSDPKAVGALQNEVEQHLSSATNVTIVRAAELATRFSGGAPSEVTLEPVDAATTERAEALFKDATYELYKDRLVAAVERFEALLTLQEQDGRFPLNERVRLRLWRASAYQALDSPGQADREIRAALSLSPDLVVDPNEFAPRLASAVSRVRGATRPRLVSVSMAGLPAGAIVAVDGRVVPVPFTVAAGVHELRAVARGFQTIRQTFEAADGAEVHVSLPLVVPDEVDASLRAIVRAGTASDEAVVALSDAVGTDWLAVVVVTADSSRSALIHLGGSPVLASPTIREGTAAAPGEIAIWMQDTLANRTTALASGSQFAIGVQQTPTGTFSDGQRSGKVAAQRGHVYGWNACGLGGGIVPCLCPGSLGAAYMWETDAPPVAHEGARSEEWFRGYRHAYEKERRSRRLKAVCIGVGVGVVIFGGVLLSGAVSSDPDDAEKEAGGQALFRF